MEELLKEIVEKLCEIAADGKDGTEMRVNLVKYAADLKLMIADSEVEPIEINEDEEAAFIQNYLLSQGSGFIATTDIKLVIDGQLEFLNSIGLAEPSNEPS